MSNQAQNNTTMSDAELGAELWPDNPAMGTTAAGRMTPEQRASYERLVMKMIWSHL